MSASIAFLSELPVVCAFAGSLVSVYTDVRYGRIKNFVTYPLILLGWAWHFRGGWEAGLVNIAVSLLAGFLVCRVGRVGAGDVKLVAGVSSCLGPCLASLFLAFFYVYLLAAALLVRLRLSGWSLGRALSCLRAEVLCELSSGAERAQEAVYGRKVGHIGAPVVFLSLVSSLILAVRGGFVW